MPAFVIHVFACDNIYAASPGRDIAVDLIQNCVRIRSWIPIPVGASTAVGVSKSCSLTGGGVDSNYLDNIN